jgi:hypothetical protein
VEPEDPYASSPLAPRFERRMRPPFAPRPVDPIAAVAANATALGLGYLLMGRRRLATAAVVGTAFLLFVLAAAPGNLPWRLLFGLWWLMMCVHAWYLTRGSDPDLLGSHRRRTRILAIGAAGLVLTVAVGLRADAWLTVRSAENTHADGDCVAAVDALDRLGAFHRIAFGAKVLEGEEQLAACRLLNEARAEGALLGADTMQTYMHHPAALWGGAGVERAGMLFDVARGGTDAASYLDSGFQQLIETLEDDPDQTDRVREAVEQLMTDLDQDTDACVAVTIDDWLGGQTWEASSFTEPIAAAAESIPVHLLQCARERSTEDDLTESQERYQRFIGEYPDHAEHQAAVDELYAVESRIEYANVSALLEADEYCKAPAPWRDAPVFEGRGPHPMWVIGLSPSQYDFPDDWTSETVDATELVVCVEGPEKGEHLESCYYEGGISAFGNYTEVDFYATRIKVKVYELRTGKEIDSYTKQFDGDPCPEELEYTYYYTDIGPPSTVEAEVSDAQVRSVFEHLQN